MNELQIAGLATFGAGCFWGVEETFRKLKGVKETAVGYEGGTMKNPFYEDVCSDRSGHAEVVQVKFDPTEISYEELLKTFWESHNPTTPNQQGPDVGTQYRSVIFYHSDEQKEKAIMSKLALEKSGKWKSPIGTALSSADNPLPRISTSESSASHLASRSAPLQNAGLATSPVVTQIVPANTFWKAEEYHQQYFMKRGGGSCHI